MPIAIVNTYCNCLYLLQLFIPIATVYTYCNCLYLLQLFIPIATVYTYCNCLYLLQLLIRCCFGKEVSASKFWAGNLWFTANSHSGL